MLFALNVTNFGIKEVYADAKIAHLSEYNPVGWNSDDECTALFLTTNKNKMLDSLKDSAVITNWKNNFDDFSKWLGHLCNPNMTGSLFISSLQYDLIKDFVLHLQDKSAAELLLDVEVDDEITSTLNLSWTENIVPLLPCKVSKISFKLSDRT